MTVKSQSFLILIPGQIYRYSVAPQLNIDLHDLDKANQYLNTDLNPFAAIFNFF